MFNRLASTGKISNVEKFKKLCDMGGHAIWEFKSHQLRFLGGFAPGHHFVVAHAVRKKKDAHSAQDLERAARILNEHADRESERMS